EQLQRFLAAFERALPRLRNAIQADQRRRPGRPIAADATFQAERRQHTPSQVARCAAEVGFETPRFWGLHAHPFPPQLEASFPAFYNELSLVLDSLDGTGASMSWSSSFLAAISKPAA